MRWYDEYEKACAEGSNALVFTGSVSDGFPRSTAAFDPGDPYPDALDPWAEAMLRRADPAAFAWSYDVIGGFRFRSPEDEKAFRRIAFGELGAKGGAADPIEAARNAMSEAAGFPSEPLAAFALMHEVFERHASGASRRPCIAILPNVDAYMATAGPAGDRAAGRAALSALRFAERDAFRRAGHRLLMSAGAMSSLDERLARPESPIRPIRVTKPDEEARTRFLRDVCGHVDAMKSRLGTIGKEIVDAEKRERGERRALLGTARKELKDYRRNKARQVRQALRKASASERNRYARLMKDRARYAKLLKHPEEQEMTGAVWRRLREGDHIVLTSKCSPKITYKVRCLGSHVRLAKQGGGGFRFESRRFQNGFRVEDWIFSWSKGRMMRRSSYLGYDDDDYDDNVPKPAPVPEDLIRTVRIPRETVEARRLIETADRDIARILQRLRPSMTSDLKRRQERVVRLEAALETPASSGGIRRLEAERVALEAWIKDPPVAPPPLPRSAIAEFARLTRGFGYRDLVRLLDLMRLRKRALTDAELAAYRADLLRKSYGHLFEIVEPLYGFEGVAGLDHVKAFFGSVRQAILSGDLKAAPMGCLLLGPPGTGKTAVAEAFARECGFLFVKMRNLRAMWVGESERKQEEALQGLRDLAPVVVLRDEVDEDDAGRDSFQGDSGVSGRLRRMWMEFLSDPAIRGRAFVIGCSNRPDRLDAALKRSGRADERIPLLMPDAATRAEIFAVMMRRHGFPCALKRFGAYARLTEGLSGADIEVIARRAYGFAAAKGKKAIDDRALRAAIADFIPSASQADIARMTLSAIRETSSRGYLPKDVKRIETAAAKALAA